MVQKLSKAFAKIIIRFRYGIIAGTLLAVIAFAFCIQFLNFENDMTFWVDKNSRIGSMPHYINETFGNNTPLLIAIKTDDFFTRENMAKLRTLAGKIEEIEHVSEVVALTTVDDIVPIEYGIRVENLIPEVLPESDDEMQSLKARVLENRNYAGRLVSAKGDVVLVIVKLDFGIQADKIANTVRLTAETIFSGESEELYFSGNTFLLNAISSIVIGDFIFLIPLVTLLVIGVLFLSFKSLRGVILPLLTVLFSTTIMMGIMSLLNVPLNVMSSAVPVILIAVGSAYGIHVINNYNEQITRTKDKAEIIANVLKDVGLPVVMAGLTTMAGFLSNITAEVSIIKTFGIFTAIGVILAVIIALLFIPAVLYILKINPPKKSKKKNIPLTRKGENYLQKIAELVIKRKYIVLVCFLVIVAVCGFFAAFITAKVDILGYFSKDSEPQAASRFVTQHFGGFNPLNIYIKADASDPDVLKTLLLLEEHMKSYEQMPAPSSAAAIVSQLNNAMTGFYTIPETKAEVENLLFFVDGQEMLSSLMTKEKDEILVSVLVPSIENTYLEGLFSHIDSFLADFREGIRVEENNPGHPALLWTESLLIKNLLDDNQIKISDEELEHLVRILSENAASYIPQTNVSAVYDYAVSDEAEIFLEDEEARLLTNSIAEMKKYTLPAFNNAVKASLLFPGDFDDEDIEWFAKSILQRIEESGEKNMLLVLEGILEEKIPELKQTSHSVKSYILAPFLWKTIPVNIVSADTRKAGPGLTGTDTNSRIIRTTPVETMEITGTVRLVEDMRKSIFLNQIISILIALAAVFILNTFTFRSIKEGLVSLAAIITTILVNFGIMGIFNIPLDFVTAIIAGVAIGTGIDYTIHFITRFSRELKNNSEIMHAYKTTLATTGKGIVFNAAAVALGFLVLLGSNVIPLRTAGILLASTMATSSISALTLMPALLAVTKVFKRKHAEEKKKIVKPRIQPVRPLRQEENG